MELDWVTIPDFPNYVISNYGDIVNVTSGRWMKQSTTSQGVIKVGLIRSSRQFTRSVAVMVATAFVSGRDDICDTPIHLDGNRSNNRADNLAWRPRWFAWRYSSQFSSISESARIGPLRDVGTGRRFMDVYEAAICCGLLFEDIRKSLVMKEPCFPTFQRFEII